MLFNLITPHIYTSELFDQLNKSLDILTPFFLIIVLEFFFFSNYLSLYKSNNSLIIFF